VALPGEKAVEVVQHVMSAEQALELLAQLSAAGVDACVGGGWAVDGLLGEQTREHSDLDLWVTANDLDPLIRTFADRGLDRLLPWGGDRPWNFVLHDGAHLRVDLHLYEPRGDGTWHYGSALEGHRFPDEALRGRGSLAGTSVRCDAPAWSVRWHTGYPPRDVDRHDVTALCSRFDLPLPPGF
jgi:lincosamide nucleotidyltransferase A/C/D/E